jgi:hypothetical protein
VSIDQINRQLPIPLTTIELGIGKLTVAQIIDQVDCDFVALKIPLNCLESPYAQPHELLPFPF